MKPAQLFLFVCLFVFFIQWWMYGIWRFPGWGLNRSCSCWPTPQPQQRHILNPLSEARDWTCVLENPSRICYCWATTGTSENSTVFQSKKGEFPGGLVVRIQRFHQCSPGFDPRSGNWDPTSSNCMLQPKRERKRKKKKKKKNKCTAFPHVREIASVSMLLLRFVMDLLGHRKVPGWLWWYLGCQLWCDEQPFPAPWPYGRMADFTVFVYSFVCSLELCDFAPQII